MTLHCGACGEPIKDYHPSADYERVTMSSVKGESGVDQKKLCQKCAAAVAKEMSKYQAGKLYID